MIWNSNTRRDLLISLKERWATLPPQDKISVEQLLLAGPPIWAQEDTTDFESRRKLNVALVLSWLQIQGCGLSDCASEELNRVKSELADWNDTYANRAADSREIRGGCVRTDSNSEELRDLPISDVIETARQLASMPTGTFLVEKDPFAGYCREFPQMALEALKHVSGEGDCAVWEWSKFLDSKLREDDSHELRSSIATALISLSDQCLAESSYCASWWFQDNFDKLVKHSSNLAEQLLNKFVEIIRRYPQCSKSAVLANPYDRDWMMEAINSCAGRIAGAIAESYLSEDGLDKSAHLQRIEQLLAQREPVRQHVLTILSRKLIWFFRKDMPWTEAKILSVLPAAEELDGQAAWSGFLLSPRVDGKLFPHLKMGLLTLAKSQARFGRGHLQSIAALVLLGSLPEDVSGTPQQITHDELHDTLLSGGAEFRTKILWLVKRDLCESASVRDSRLPFVETLLSEIWPKELEVRTPEISASLLDLLLVDETVFSRLINSALPFFTALTHEQRYHFHFQEEHVKPVIEGNPERFLALLGKILPEEPEHWPYGFGNTLQLIVTAEPSLKKDVRFESLQQRWNKRW